MRKTIRNKGHFPNDEAATKLIWLALRYITATWKNPAHRLGACEGTVRDTIRRPIQPRRLINNGSHTEFLTLPDAAPGELMKWYVVGVLMLIYVFNFVDRQIISVLQEPMRAELGLTDT